MSRTRIFVQGAALSGASVLVSMAALLAVGKIFTSALTIGDVAIFGALMAAADFLNAALSLGVYHGLPKMIAAADAANRGAYVRAALLGQSIIALAFSLLFYAVYFGVSGAATGFAADYALLNAAWPQLWLVPPLFLVGALRETTMAGLAGANRYGRRAAGIAIASAGQIGFVVLALLVFDLGVAGLTGAIIAAHAVAVALMMAGLPWALGTVPVRQAWNETLRFSWPLYANSLLNFFYLRFDFFLVSALVGVPAAGVYDTIKRLPAMFSRIISSMLVPYLPNASALLAIGDRAGASRYMRHAISLTAFFGYTAALAVVVVQEPLIRLLFTEDYLSGAPVLGLLLVAIALAIQAGIIGQSLIALGHPLTITIINIGLGVASVVGNLLLLPHLGLAGAGYAALVAVCASYAMQAVAVHRFGLEIHWGLLLRPQGFLACSAVVLWWGDGGVIWRVAALGTFVALCITFGVIKVQHLRTIIAAIRPVPQARPEG